MPTPLQPSFWDNEAAALWETLFEVFLEDLTDGMLGGAEMLPSNVQALVDWDWLNKHALELARTYRYDLIKGITDTTMRQVQDAMQQWIWSGEKLGSLEAMLEPLFGSMRAERIAATEVTRIYAEGNVAAWQASGVVGAKQWMTTQDDVVCPICGELDGEIRVMDSEFISGVNVPPAHVNCRCWIQPVVDEESVGKKLDEVFSKFEWSEPLMRIRQDLLEWSEELHPRDESGKFTDGGGGEAVKAVGKGYHGTTINAVKSIIAEGLQTKYDKQTFGRAPSVYFMADLQEVKNYVSEYILDFPEAEGYAIVSFTVPGGAAIVDEEEPTAYRIEKNVDPADIGFIYLYGRDNSLIGKWSKYPQLRTGVGNNFSAKATPQIETGYTFVILDKLENESTSN